MLWCCGLAGAIAVAAFDGGPKSFGRPRAFNVFGADPVLKEDCNGLDTIERECPSRPFGGTCGILNYEEIRSELPGTELTKRYNNNQERCYDKSFPKECPKQTYFTLSEHTDCNKVKVAVEQQ